MHNMQTHNNWCNVLLTDSGFFYDGELNKPLDLLINSFKAMLQKHLAETSVLFTPTASMQNELKAIKITNRLKNELLTIGISSDNITVYDIDGSLSEEDAMKFDVIYFTGGKTPYLAERVLEKGFDKIIKKMIFANKVYIGMSAGSALLASHYEDYTNRVGEDNRATSSRSAGLDFFNLTAIADKMDDEKFEAYLELLDVATGLESCTGMSEHALLICKKM